MESPENANHAKSQEGAAPPRWSGFRAVSLAVLALAAMVWVFQPLAWVIPLVLMGILLAVFLGALSDWLSKLTGLPHGWSLGIVVLILLLLLSGFVALTGQPLVEQSAALMKELPRSLSSLKSRAEESRWGKELLKALPQKANEMPVSPEKVASYASNALSSATAALTAAVLIFFVALYLAADPFTYRNGFLRLFPPARRSYVGDVLEEVHETLRWWLLGQVVAMSIVGLLTTLGLWLIGVKFALALGMLAALLAFLPNIGPVLSAIPAVILGLMDSPSTALWVAGLYLGVQTVESYLVTPLIQERVVSLPPALLLVAQVAFGLLFGAPGLIIAAPLTAAAIALVNRIYVQDYLES